MKDIREIIARNICELRIENGLTQAKLAEALNYSDKAISKWERAESMPDIVVLKMISDYFGVSVDYLVSDVHTADQIKDKNKSVAKRRNRLVISLLAISLVWLVATFVFSVLLITVSNPVFPAWLMYIYALPATMIVALIFNSIWGKKKLNFLIVSFLIWSVLLSVFLSFITIAPYHNLWPVFIIGIPAELIVLLWAGLVFRKKIDE
jgi:transcriptional regulator with XRE-family HTH domain